MNTLQPSLHLTTSNRSALKMAKTYKELGIKNYDFLLRIYDRDLINIDPFSAHLSKIQKGKVIAEVKRNPWYYFREIARVPVPGGNVKFEFNRGNVAQLWCCMNSINFLEMLPRQKGKTVGVVSAIVYVLNFVLTNSELAFTNKAVGDAQLNLKRYHEQCGLIPQYLLAKDSKLDTENVNFYRLDSLNNKIKVISAGTSPEHADKLG